MKVSVFGLGYVGSVSAASFAADGHEVVGVDVNADKVAAVNAGRSPIVEPGLDELLGQGASQGRLRATTDTADAIQSSEVSLLCVGTPSRKNGSLDLSYLESFLERLGGSCPIPLLVGIFYVRSYQLALRLHNEVPGIVVPEHVQSRLLEAGPAAGETGLAIARELLEASRELAAGVYVIPPFRQPHAALDLFT